MSIDQRPAKTAKVDPIVFTEDDAKYVHYPHNDALVITTVIGNHSVHRIMVDSGSSIDVLNFDALVCLGLGKEKLKPMMQPIYGFTGDCVVPEGIINLPLTVGEKPNRATVCVDFVVIKR